MPERRKPASKRAKRARTTSGSQSPKRPPAHKKVEKTYRSIAELRREFYPDSDAARSSADATRATPESVLGIGRSPR
jgi:hypothetical protein